MDKKDLVFLAAAQATSSKFSGLVDLETANVFFTHWYNIFKDLYLLMPKEEWEKVKPGEM